jgi:protoporphyrinogen oxidase
MTKIVILGAGATGLSAAYHLEKKGFRDYHIFEKEKNIGGLCRSKQQDGFTFDYTGHLLHINDGHFRSFIAHAVGMEQLNTICRKSFIYSQNTYSRYPYQINLYGLPVETVVECIEGYVNRPQSSKRPKFFTDWVHQTFGAGFGKYFFFPYQKKIFSYDIKKLSASWTTHFVPSTSLRDIIRGSVHDHFDTDIGYNATFFYPKFGGISYWIECMAQRIQNPIMTEWCVNTIDLTNKIITFTNGETVPYDSLISTIPLDKLLQFIKEPSSLSIKKALGKLLCNSVINFNLGLRYADFTDKHWIYFPETKYPFYRIGFPHNFSLNTVPPGCSSLYGEFSHLNGSSQIINRRLKEALKATKKLLRISDSDIETECVIPISHAYVIFNEWRDKNLPKLLKTLAHYNIHSIGRYGAWKYSSMQDSFLDGKKIADQLVVIPAQQSAFIPHAITKKPREIQS